MKKHTKHLKLERRQNDIYAPFEISILGVKCSTITYLVKDIARKLHKKYSIGYLDAYHSDTATAPAFSSYTFHHSGSLAIKTSSNLNKYSERIRLAAHDLTFINGNHFPGKKQILFLDAEKENSIFKRLKQIDNIQFIIKTDVGMPIFDFILQKYPEVADIPTYHADDLEGITKHVEALLIANKPVLNGLVLAGGKSTRMGRDKGLLDYHGMPQREFLVELLEQGLTFSEQQQLLAAPELAEQQLIGKVYLSLEKEDEDLNYAIISDKFIELGPFGGICSAFMQNPNEAFLVVATDLPYLDEKLIQLLIENRNPKKMATTIQGIGNEFPEPLVTIWEPKAYPVLLSYLAQGYSCPRKVLINSDVEIVEVDPSFIHNVNTPREFEKAKEDLEN